MQYNKDNHTCKAMLQNGNFIVVDPFVGNAIVDFSDDDFANGKGMELIGNNYILIEYLVERSMVVAYEAIKI
jgi:hypothetical protein